MKSWTVRPWARPFVLEEEIGPKNVTPNPAVRSMREAMEARRAELEHRLSACRRVNRLSLGLTVGLFVVSQIPLLPSWVHWTTFLVAIITGAIVFTSWWDAVTAKKLLELASADLLAE